MAKSHYDCPFLRSKGKLLLYSNGFLFHFRVFSNFLSKLGPFKSAICLFDDFQGESLPHVQRKRWDVKDMFLVLISQILIFLFVLCESVLSNEGFSIEIFFKQYAAPSTDAFVWPSFHFHNFTQRFC